MAAARRILTAVRDNVSSLALGSGAGEEILLTLLEERTKQILPAHFEVHRADTYLRLSGVGPLAGRMVVWTPVFVLRSKLPRDQRLNLVFQSYAEKVQQFVTKTQHSPWPSPGAAPHVSITDGSVSVWWGGEREDQALVRIASIPTGGIT